jgi:hypothetical protein
MRSFDEGDEAGAVVDAVVATGMGWTIGTTGSWAKEAKAKDNVIEPMPNKDLICRIQTSRDRPKRSTRFCLQKRQHAASAVLFSDEDFLLLGMVGS